MELYGLAGFIDEHIFGDIKSFKEQFLRISDEAIYSDLKERIKPICQSTLRRQVREYIQYTNRLAIVQELLPGESEQLLYDYISEYLRRPSLYALPSSQRQLISLILLKLLASSSYAIAKTLRTLIIRLENALKKDMKIKGRFMDNLSEDYENLSELEDEWDNGAGEFDEPMFTDEERESVRKEIADLEKFAGLAESISHDAKGNVLLKALGTGFQKANELGARRKALIFT
jgi:hypothetical protein